MKTTPMGSHSLESLWKNRDFVFLITGRTVSQFGTAMTTFVIPWLLLQLTGSGTQVGVAFAVSFVPYIIVSFPAGVWADRFNRKVLMIVADSLRLTMLLSIPLSHLAAGKTPLYLLYMVQAGVSGLSAIFDAAYGACLPNIVASDQLREANNALQTTMSLSRILGPIFGGVVISWFGASNAILVDVVSYIVSIMSMVTIVKSFSVLKRTDHNTFFQDIRQGATTVWEIRPIRYLMLFATLINLVGPGMDVALLYRLQHEFVLSSRWVGVIMAGLSGGMLLGSLVNGWIRERIDIGLLLTISTVLQVFPPFILSFTTSPILILIVQVFIGILLVAWNVQSVTLRQTLIPNHLLGRGSSVFRLSAWITIPLGDALAGMISQVYGTHMYFFIATGVLFTVAVLSISVKLHRVMPETGRNLVSN